MEENPLEKEIEEKLRKAVEKRGGRCLKWVCPGQNGVPDRMCLLPNGLIFFVETKRPKGGKVSELQKFWARVLKGLGFEHAFIFTEQAVKDFANYMDLTMNLKQIMPKENKP